VPHPAAALGTGLGAQDPDVPAQLQVSFWAAVSTDRCRCFQAIRGPPMNNSLRLCHRKPFLSLKSQTAAHTALGMVVKEVLPTLPQKELELVFP
jgi:hypothetical protein